MMSDLVYKEDAYKIIGKCMEVNNNLGSGFIEIVYMEMKDRQPLINVMRNVGKLLIMYIIAINEISSSLKVRCFGILHNA